MVPFCVDPLSAYPVHLLTNTTGAITLVIGLCYIIMAVMNVVLIKYQEHQAFLSQQALGPSLQSILGKGYVNSAVFPVFERVLWLNSIIIVIVGATFLAFPYEPAHDQNIGQLVAYSVIFASEHIVVDGVAFLFLRKGLGWNSAKIVLIWVSIWSTFVGLCRFFQYYLSSSYPTASIVVDLIWQVPLLVFYLALWLAPAHRLFRRPAAIIYARFWAVFRVVSIAADVLIFVSVTGAAGQCFLAFGVLLVFALFEPFIIYFALLRDSRWWQGLRIRRGRGDSKQGEEIKQPLNGIDLNIVSAQRLAESVDDMIKDEIKLLNFAYVQLDKDKPLGSGSFSKVYRGSYRKHPCAVKIIFTVDLTEEIVNRIAAEAHILSQIQHPNVIHIYGVSVLPPSVGILLELCDYGSLASLVSGYSVFNNASVPPVIALSRADRLFLALGAARGLAALHAYSEDLVHRDVKSFNFLVDNQLNVKIADLELGTLPPAKVPTSSTTHPSTSISQSICACLLPGLARGQDASTDAGDHLTDAGDLESRGSSHIYQGLRRNEILANWAAPEVIRAGIHVKASDVYSLSLVLWEIISGEVPFSASGRQDDIRRKVLDGERPAMPSFEGDSSGNLARAWGHYTALIERGWQHEPKIRPTAFQIEAEIECMWKAIGHSAILDVEGVVDVSKIIDKHVDHSVKSYRKNSIDGASSFSESFTSAAAIALSFAAQGRTGSQSGPSTSMSYGTMRKDNDFSSLISKELAAELTASLLNPIDAESFAQLESSKEPWILVTRQSPFVIAVATAAFKQFANIATDASLCGYPITALTHTSLADEGKLDKFLSSLNTASEGGYSHCLLPLYISEPGASLPWHKAISLKDSCCSLISVHSFPVLRRDPYKDSSTPVREQSLFSLKESPDQRLTNAPMSSIIGKVPVGGIAYYALLFSRAKDPQPVAISHTSSNSQLATYFFRQPVVEIGSRGAKVVGWGVSESALNTASPMHESK